MCCKPILLLYICGQIIIEITMNTACRFILSTLFCLITSSLTTTSASEIFKHLTIDNGLAHTDANCIAQDSTGMIWIGTYAGLQSYDGYTLQAFDYYPQGHKIYQSHNRINAMACNKKKLWVGTESGLACFDLSTHRYIPYHITEEIDSDLLKTNISHLSIDPSGRYMWLGTSKGMTVMQTSNDTISALKWNNEEERIFSKNIGIPQYQGDNIWASNGWYVLQLNIRNGIVYLQTYYSTRELLGRGEDVKSVYSSQKCLYIRTGSGCYRFSISDGQLNKSTRTYVCFNQVFAGIPKLTNGEFIVNNDGTLWCAYSEGLFEMQEPFSQKPFARIHLKNTWKNDQSVQKVSALLIDKYGNLWITMKSWGAYYRTLSKSLFKNISQSDFQEMGFSQNEIVAITGQKDGTIWMIVEYGSLFRYDSHTEHLSFVPLQKTSSEAVYYQALCASSDQKHLYIGMSRGVFVFNTQTQTLKPLFAAGSPEANKIAGSIAYLTEDEFGQLWVGTWGDGLFCISHPLVSPSITLQLNTQTDPRILSDNITNMLIKNKSVFLCTTNGLNRIQLTENGRLKGITAYQANAGSSTSMSSNYLASIDCENDSICWVGTIGGGLNKLVLHSDRTNDYTASCYTIQDGLTGNDCEIVLLDSIGNVWIGGNGITQLDTKKNMIYTYGSANGLRSNAFKINVSYKNEDGTFYMGGLYGLSYFQPVLLTRNDHPKELIFTNLSINNQPIVPNTTYNGRTLLSKILDKTSEITLDHRQNNFMISFAALGYELSEQVMYRYRLKGFQEEWHTLRYVSNEIYYSNLPYGTYELEVQLSTDKGYTWNVPAKSLQITVLPPWWLSVWAKTSYLCLIVLITIIAFRQYTKEQNLKRENEIQKIIIAKDEEKYQAKMQFFMNASHELKTPLTLILLAAEKLRGENLLAKECKAILLNARKMLSLITELVDIRKVDLGLNSMNLTHVNFSQISHQLFEEINTWTENKQLSINYISEKEDIEMDADKDKISKLIINLFTNAIKYTDEGGQVEISLKRGTAKDIVPCYNVAYTEGDIEPGQAACILTVKDTGVGISPESIRLIYERFFQVAGNASSHLGSGIGLAIVKSIVLQHKGMITVSSERMVGTEFIVALPISNLCATTTRNGQPAFSLEEFISEQYNEFEPMDKVTIAAEEEANIVRPELPALLLVEDNKELQMALKEHFSSTYNVHIADNGHIGLEKCMALFPDIIISDVMMPEMDGIEMCSQIKNNLSIAHIPLVLLTARDNVESQIEGYESGADLYLPKPFSLKLLEVNLRRLLAQREQWFKGNVAATFTPVAMDEPEKKDEPVKEISRSILSTEEVEAMINQLKTIIGKNLQNPDLSPDHLSNALGISRTKLYREVKRIDGQSLSDYVRNVRLEKAASLLVSSNLNVQEVMGEVGFINCSHFTKIFKLKYGIAPSEYKKQLQKSI